MRRLLSAIFVVLATPLLMAAGQAPPAAPHHVEMSDADRGAVDAISAYLNGLTTLKGGFLQINGDGSAVEGNVYIQKPGKMRFDYKPPSASLIVSDGHTVAVANRRLNTVDHYLLKDIPLSVILGDKIDIRHSPQLVSVQHDSGAIILGLRSSLNRSKANIYLMFSEPDYELRQWTVIDDQGSKTTVVLRGLTPGVALAPTLFVLPRKGALMRRPEN
ncbi:MAG: outer membrane lipoprotein carrier protein LolA [Proteobacteria bacterium]|nr:outer membrane lipoprotein carrier protein LolA [Pseudomonadota bacterium]